MDLSEKLNLSMDEFLDYLVEEDEKKPSDSEIILSYGKGIEEINSEMGEFQDKLMFLIHKNNISIKNKAEFILDICNRENKDELLPLMASFICENEYIDRLKNKKKSTENKGSLAKYILLEIRSDFSRLYNLYAFRKGNVKSQFYVGEFKSFIHQSKYKSVLNF